VIEGLLFDEARAFISNLDSADFEFWYAWKDEWPDWRHVQDVEGLTEIIFRVLHVAPPPPPRGTKTEDQSRAGAIVKNIQANVTKFPNWMEKSYFPQNEDSHSLSITTGEFVIRSQKRFYKRLMITVVGEEEKTFKTHTKDVSIGGMNLEDSLPDWVAGYFKVRIAKLNSKQQIELTCCLIENQEPNGRYRIAILPMKTEQDEKNLESWLAA